MAILILFDFAVLFVISTYIFMVVISLIGRWFFLTRWFLNQPLPSTEDGPSAQATSSV